MKFKLISLLFVLALMSSGHLSAQNYAVALKISTMGISCEGIRSFGSSFNSRVGFSIFNCQFDNGAGEEEDFKYDAKLKLLSFSALVDWYPFKNSLHLTSGALINLNEGDLTLFPNESYKIGGTLYTPQLMGTVSAKVKLNKVAPYLGIGLGRPTSGHHFTFAIDLGVIYQGSPKVDLSADGLLEPSTEQGPLIEDNIKWLKFYPVISLGISYKF